MAVNVHAAMAFFSLVVISRDPPTHGSVLSFRVNKSLVVEGRCGNRGLGTAPPAHDGAHAHAAVCVQCRNRGHAVEPSRCGSLFRGSLRQQTANARRGRRDGAKKHVVLAGSRGGPGRRHRLLSEWRRHVSQRSLTRKRNDSTSAVTAKTKKPQPW